MNLLLAVDSSAIEIGIRPNSFSESFSYLIIISLYGSTQWGGAVMLSRGFFACSFSN